MNRIDQTFAKLKAEGRTALIPFFTAGDPSREATVPVMHALAKAGADVIELGVPFSDPMADGPVIQASSDRALALKVSLRDVLAWVAEFRQTNQLTPVVLMGYANPVEAMGQQTFVTAAQAAGVDGVLVVDYPPEEAEDWSKHCDKAGLAPIFLLSPTTPVSRLAKAAELARGYVYYVSLRGVTGAGHLDVVEVSSKLAEIRQHIKIPLGVGFGIRDAATAKAVGEVADAVVIGSRLVQEMQTYQANDPAGHAGAWLATIRQALDTN
jgi:tryptophan synthase alpha chain